jgi:hypothetical protein
MLLPPKPSKIICGSAKGALLWHQKMLVKLYENTICHNLIKLIIDDYLQKMYKTLKRFTTSFTLKQKHLQILKLLKMLGFIKTVSEI